MRILISTSPGVGHLLPLLPLARAARDRGHDVRIAAGAGLASIVANAGFPHLVAGPPNLGAVASEITALEGLTGRRRAVVMVREGFAGSIAGGIATDLLAAFSDDSARDPWRPDLILHEDMELGSWIVAERLGIPHATVQVTAVSVRSCVGSSRPRSSRCASSTASPTTPRIGCSARSSSRRGRRRCAARTRHSPG